MKSFKSFSACLIIAALFFTACKNNAYESSVPFAPVNIRLHLSLHAPHLFAINSNQYYTKTNPSIGVYDVGYGGVLIYSMLGENGSRVYRAFDMTCPYEIDANVRVYPDITTGLSAICEKCGSKFNLNWGLGQVEEGPAEENLKRFNAHFDGTYLRITPRLTH